MNNDDIKRIVSETVTNPDVMSFLVKQIQDQIEKEQSKLEQNKISDKKVEPKMDNTKNKVNDIKTKADNYTSNNEYVNKYISERDKYMDVFKKVSEKLNEAEDNKETNKKEITQEPFKKSWTQNISQASMMHNFSDGWYKWHQETTDGKVCGNIFFDLIRGNNNNFDTFLNIYSVLTLYADKWENWEIDHYDNTLYNFPISKLVDTYTYNFTADESKKIDNNEDMVYSYTHVEIDNELPMVSIYIMDYSKKTNKVYDFNRIIFTPSDNASKEDIKRFYWHLFNYFRDDTNVRYILEDYCYTFINKYIIHGSAIMPTTDKEYCKIMNLYLMSILEPKKQENMKVVEEVEIKATDTPDKTNSILDKLGIPHNNGVVDIPISDDKFISNRMDSMNKASEFLKSWFDFDDEEEMEDVPIEDNGTNKNLNEDDKYSDWSIIDTGYENYDDFLANAINDGFIKIEVLSDDHIHLNINGTLVFMNNPYTTMDDRDAFGNKL